MSGIGCSPVPSCTLSRVTLEAGRLETSRLSTVTATSATSDSALWGCCGGRGGSECDSAMHRSDAAARASVLASGRSAMDSAIAVLQRGMDKKRRATKALLTIDKSFKRY